MNPADFGESKEAAVFNFLLKTDDIEKVLDLIELTFMFIEKYIKTDLRSFTYDTKIEQTPDEAIEELNFRFKESGVGYRYEDGKIIRVDSTYTHSEIVKPVLTLLHNSKFKGANEEYLKAHEHYRHGRNKECLTECLKAFESTIKIIL